jgi:hypothetical protein
MRLTSKFPDRPTPTPVSFPFKILKFRSLAARAFELSSKLLSDLLH